MRVNGQYPPGGAFSAETPVAGTPAPTQAAGQGPLSSAWRLRQALWSLWAAGWEGHPRPVSPTLLLQPLFTLRRDPLMAREGRGRGPPGGPGWRRGADASPTPGSQGCTGAWGRGGKGLGGHEGPPAGSGEHPASSLGPQVDLTLASQQQRVVSWASGPHQGWVWGPGPPPQVLQSEVPSPTAFQSTAGCPAGSGRVRPAGPGRGCSVKWATPLQTPLGSCSLGPLGGGAPSFPEPSQKPHQAPLGGWAVTRDPPGRAASPGKGKKLWGLRPARASPRGRAWGNRAGRGRPGQTLPSHGQTPAQALDALARGPRARGAGRVLQG